MDYEMYLMESGLVEDTQDTYRDCLKLLKPWIREKRIWASKFRGKHFVQFINEVRPYWANASQYNCLAAAKGYFLWRYGAKHPLLKFKIKRLESPMKPPLSRKQVDQLIAATGLNERTAIRDRALVQLLAITGMRAKEAATLRLVDVDLERLRVQVMQKRGRWHTAIFGQHTADILKAWLDERPKHAKNGAETCFVSLGGILKGEALTRHGVKQILYYVCERAGLEKISPHRLRYFMVVNGAERGVNLKVLQRQGGWASIKYVSHYAKGVESEAYRAFLPNFA